MPEDLAQQVPYIRRALEAYRIPMIGVTRFEADDVIGTLARKAADAGRPVYIVSSDKDMMQLVNDKVHILNPPKDNLICDAAKVEEILGVPPERVIDVMALRGDSIDNIPGAPGIGDKGSVEIIKRFGSVEAALDHAAEVERKTYRESLQNNRDTILFSKSMATIDTNVPVELDVDSMHAGDPDIDALRSLFTELEFTSLLKELLPVAEVSDTHYTDASSAEDIERVLNSVSAESALSVAVEHEESPASAEQEGQAEEEVPQHEQLSLMGGALRAEVEQQGLSKVYEEIDMPLVPVLTRMEQAGVKIDVPALANMSVDLEREIRAKEKEIHEVAGTEFNVGSPKQLGDVLFNRMDLPKPVKYGKGRTISTAVDVLEDLAENYPIARMVLDYRQLTKLKSTYVDALPVLINAATGRLHTTFAQTGTATGRLSSANPNLQNIPIRTELGRGIRAAFIAEPGHILLTADYSQIELRLLAHFSGDSLLVEAYRRGDDIHTLTASQVSGVPPLMF